jgi:hypothetical protein
MVRSPNYWAALPDFSPAPRKRCDAKMSHCGMSGHDSCDSALFGAAGIA